MSTAAEKTRKRINRAVKKIVMEEIRHGFEVGNPNIREKERTLYRHDGTHLSHVRTDIYLQNIQAALESFISQEKRLSPE